MPGVYNLDLYRGDTYAKTFRVWDDLAMTDPADLTGVTAAAQIRESPDGETALPLVCVVTLPNTIAVSLAASAWAGVALAGGGWDLQLTNAGGVVTTLLKGKVKVTADYTKVAV